MKRKGLALFSLMERSLTWCYYSALTCLFSFLIELLWHDRLVSTAKWWTLQKIFPWLNTFLNTKSYNKNIRSLVHRYLRDVAIYSSKTRIMIIYRYILIATSILPAVSGGLQYQSFLQVCKISATYISIIKSFFIFSVILIKAWDIKYCCLNPNCKS